MDLKYGAKWQALLLLVPWVLVGFGLRVWRALLQLVMFRDETTYAFQIRHVLEGTIFRDPTYFTFPPTYAFLAAPLALFTGDAELAGRLVSCALGAATVVPVFYLARDLYGIRAAAVAGFLTAVFPPFCLGGVMSEATYGFFIALGLYMANRARNTRRGLDFALFGLVMGLCYLSRPEGFFVFFACLAVLVSFVAIGMADRKRAAVLAGAALAGFMLLSFPYMLQLKAHFGAWEISGKTRINLAKVKAREMARPGDDLDRLDAKVYSDMEKDRPGLGANMARELSAIAKRYPGNLLAEIKDFPAVAGYMLIAACLLGFAFALLRPGRLWELGLLAAGVTPLLLIPAVFILGRILVPYLSVVFVLAGYGIARAGELAGEGAGRILGRRPIANVLTGALAMVALSGHFGNILPETDTDKVRQSDGLYDYYCTLRALGEGLRPSMPHGAVILTRDNVFAYYAGGEYMPIPSTDITGLVRYARENKAGFVFYGPMEQQMRPQYMPYFLANGRPVADPLGDGSMRLVYADSVCLLYKVTGQGG